MIKDKKNTSNKINLIILKKIGTAIIDNQYDILKVRKFLKKDSWLLLEHGYNQQDSLIKELSRFGYSDILGLKDYANIDRVVAARWEVIDN